jgi:hypothetical protein
MVNVLECGRSKDYKVGICCCSVKHATFRIKSKDGIQEMCPNEAICLSVDCLNEAICLSVDCCFRELALYKSN